MRVYDIRQDWPDSFTVTDGIQMKEGSFYFQSLGKEEDGLDFPYLVFFLDFGFPFTQTETPTIFSQYHK
jgi:hypothetical protein